MARTKLAAQRSSDVPRQVRKAIEERAKEARRVARRKAKDDKIKAKEAKTQKKKEMKALLEIHGNSKN